MYKLMQIRFLLSTGVNYPLIKDYGFQMNKPIFAVVSSEDFADAINLFKGRGGAVIKADMTKSEKKESLRNINSGYAVCPVNNKNNERFALELLSEYSSGFLYNLKVDAPLIIVSSCVPLGIDLSGLISVDLRDIDFSGVDFTDDEIVPNPENVDALIREFQLTHPGELDCFALTAAFLEYIDRKKINVDDDYVKIADAIKNTGIVLVDDIRDTLSEVIYEKRSVEGRLCEVSEVTIDDVENRDAVIFFNERYIFLSEKLLKKFCKAAFPNTSIDVVKSQLRNEGLLLSDSKETYTAKMYFSLNQNRHFLRMIRLDREQLCIGSNDLIQQIQWSQVA